MRTFRGKRIVTAWILALALVAVPALAQDAPTGLEVEQAEISETRARINALLLNLDRKMPNREVNAIAKQAEKAFEADESNIDARLDYATAMWLQGRQAGKMSGYMKGLPQTSRRILNEARALAPEHPGVLAQLGVWHMDVFRRGGQSGAKRLKADFATGLEYWRDAQMKDPSNLAMALHGAFILLAMEDAAYTEEAKTVLLGVANAPTKDDLDASFSARAQTVLGNLEAGAQDAVEDDLIAWLGRK